jgi:hypothetical protein
VLAGDVSLGEVEDAEEPLEEDDDLADEAPSETFSGATMSGVVLGTVSCDTLLPPQALNPPVARSIRPRAAARRAITGKPGSGFGRHRQRGHPAAAGRAVVEVLLRQLVTPVAEAQVLDRPGQAGRARRERDDLADDLEGLAGVAVAVELAGLGLEEDLAPRGGGAHAVALLDAHDVKVIDHRREKARNPA